MQGHGPALDVGLEAFGLGALRESERGNRRASAKSSAASRSDTPCIRERRESQCSNNKSIAGEENGTANRLSKAWGFSELFIEASNALRKPRVAPFRTSAQVASPVSIRHCFFF
jgi:hypothetical protein